MPALNPNMPTPLLDASSTASSRWVALTAHGVRGRGTLLNPPNRFEGMGFVPEAMDVVAGRASTDVLDAGAVDDADFPSPSPQTTLLTDASRSIINHVEPAAASDLPNIRFTLNPYRGCEHGCVYCYARPGHEYLGMSSGLDFETKILAKLDAPTLLERELSRPRWRAKASGSPIMLSGVTDCYQPLEKSLRLTRACLKVLLRFGQPVSIVTKSRLIVRDLDILQELARRRLVHVAISLTTLDNQLAASMEPRAAAPRARLETIRALARAGVPTMVMAAPIIPAVNDHEIPAILREARRAGAISAGYVLLRLPYQNKELFLDWLRRHLPDRAAKVEAQLRDARGGALYRANWGTRLRGEGPVAERIASVFRVFARRYGLDQPMPDYNTSMFSSAAQPASRADDADASADPARDPDAATSHQTPPPTPPTPSPTPPPTMRDMPGQLALFGQVA